MAYKVIKYFADLQDNNRPYEVGCPYPREGLEPSKERIAELAGSKNLQGEPLIALIEETKPAKKAASKKADK